MLSVKESQTTFFKQNNNEGKTDRSRCYSVSVWADYYHVYRHNPTSRSTPRTDIGKLVLRRDGTVEVVTKTKKVCEHLFAPENKIGGPIFLS